jgi:hypothetical protein
LRKNAVFRQRLARGVANRETKPEEPADEKASIFTFKVASKAPHVRDAPPERLIEIRSRARLGLSLEEKALSHRLLPDFGGKADRATVVKVQIEQAPREEGERFGNLARLGDGD